jgi:hypothetical protein
VRLALLASSRPHLRFKKGKIPPNILFENPNLEILFREWKIEVPYCLDELENSW